MMPNEQPDPDARTNYPEIHQAKPVAQAPAQLEAHPMDVPGLRALVGTADQQGGGRCRRRLSPLLRALRGKEIPREKAGKGMNLYAIDIKTGCWIWSGSISDRGYGTAKRKGKFFRAHRLIYEEKKGVIPKGMTLDHLCRNRICVNPDHLEPVTQKENSLRGNSICGINSRKTHCIRGHEFSNENTIRDKNGGRRCRICKNFKMRIYRAKKNVSI